MKLSKADGKHPVTLKARDLPSNRPAAGVQYRERYCEQPPSLSIPGPLADMVRYMEQHRLVHRPPWRRAVSALIRWLRRFE